MNKMSVQIYNLKLIKKHIFFDYNVMLQLFVSILQYSNLYCTFLFSVVSPDT